MRFFLLLLLVLTGFLACKPESFNKVDISNININFSVDRFDEEFYTSSNKKLTLLKKKYPYFFPKEITDSISLSKINSKDEQELFAETQKIYKDFSTIEKQLTSLFKHVKYYNPKFETPKIITMLTNIDYSNRVIYTDSLLIVSLDVYLGKNHPFYSDYPKYIRENNTKNRIVVDVANAIIATQLKPTINRSFISKMIYEGKKMYVLDVYLPEVSKKLKIGYEQERLNWAIANEEQIWMYFIEKQLLFSTDNKLNKRFLDIAPFSKFYTSEDNASPGRIGVWLGWQIVNAYMQNNDVSLQALLSINPEDLFKKSKYKPRK